MNAYGAPWAASMQEFANGLKADGRLLTSLTLADSRQGVMRVVVLIQIQFYMLSLIA